MATKGGETLYEYISYIACILNGEFIHFTPILYHRQFSFGARHVDTGTIVSQCKGHTQTRKPVDLTTRYR
jgi:hypothetical protein